VSAADAPDLGQEVFKAVARKVNDFHRDQVGDSFRAWIRAITRNKILDYFRGQQAEVSAAGGSEALTRLQQVPALEEDAPDSVSDAEETSLLYQQAVELIRTQFQERTWQAFWRVVVEEERPADVAAHLQMTVNAVYLARSRVLGRLREEFKDLVDI
jgi:RNA polymerase sigma-70 factor (ECF subfamily)